MEKNASPISLIVLSLLRLDFIGLAQPLLRLWLVSSVAVPFNTLLFEVFDDDHFDLCGKAPKTLFCQFLKGFL